MTSSPSGVPPTERGCWACGERYAAAYYTLMIHQNTGITAPQMSGEHFEQVLCRACKRLLADMIGRVRAIRLDMERNVEARDEAHG